MNKSRRSGGIHTSKPAPLMVKCVPTRGRTHNYKKNMQGTKEELFSYLGPLLVVSDLKDTGKDAEYFN